MTWTEIYTRLRHDRNDPESWAALDRIVHTWAQPALHQRGRESVEDAVAETCSTIAITFDRARGAETFHGFALGVFYNARPEPCGCN